MKGFNSVTRNKHFAPVDESVVSLKELWTHSEKILKAMVLPWVNILNLNSLHFFKEKKTEKDKNQYSITHNCQNLVTAIMIQF